MRELLFYFLILGLSTNIAKQFTALIMGRLFTIFPTIQWRIQDLKKRGRPVFFKSILANLGDFLKYLAKIGGESPAATPPPPGGSATAQLFKL